MATSVASSKSKVANDIDDSVASEISDRLSQELVVALVGPVGSGVSSAASIIETALAQKYGYSVCPIIKLSDIIRGEAHRVSKVDPKGLPLDQYILEMQNTGNDLREKFGGNYLIEKSVEKIRKYRQDNGGYKGEIALPGRRAYIIDSIKNQEELNLLRQIYRETLCVIGVFAPDTYRERRLRDAGADEGQVKKILDRDQGEVLSFGQNTRKLFVQADFFVCNDRVIEEMRKRIERFLEILFDAGIHTPTTEETAMYKASASAANSACMSRQVGASIVSDRGELIAVGCNDVPKFGGGLYIEDDRTRHTTNGPINTDHRCYNWRGGICHNEVRRNGIIDEVVKRIATADGMLQPGRTAVDIKNSIQGSGIEDLIEFSRSIHAEMEAILSVAREGKHSLVGATLYTTTYPCHNCARHIVAAGITSVVYIEPYKKSLAIALHEDAITESREESDKVVFRQFDGIAPDNFLRLFRPASIRKKGGKLNRTPALEALPIFRIPLDAQSHYEDKVIADLTEKEQG